MPAIGNIVIDQTDGSDGGDDITLEPDFARKDEARWVQVAFPELSRMTLTYNRRGADPKTGLVKHTFRFTRPTLKSEVTDPSGPFEPAPTLDYVSVAEYSLWLHPRSTSDARILFQSALTAMSASQKAVLSSVADGKSIY